MDWLVIYWDGLKQEFHSPLITREWKYLLNWNLPPINACWNSGTFNFLSSPFCHPLPASLKIQWLRYSNAERATILLEARCGTLAEVKNEKKEKLNEAQWLDLKNMWMSWTALLKYEFKIWRYCGIETKQDPMVLIPLCLQSAFCLWKNFSQRISLNREVRKCRNKGKQSNKTK